MCAVDYLKAFFKNPFLQLCVSQVGKALGKTSVCHQNYKSRTLDSAVLTGVLCNLIFFF